ncbi:MAG: threonine ammonia-lyase [Deltaproteobacteria bacterium]|nr:threonine ammonia-lyase [Deltaproteobacteria bacterium]
MTPDLTHIEAAREGFQNLIHPSPLIRSGYFSRLLGAEIFLKLENLQETGSFKVRGAYNRLCALSPEEKKRGVIAASAGNHAQGVAWAAARLGIAATIVMPEDVSVRKYLAVKEYGGEILLFGKHYSESYAHALSLAQEKGVILIPGFDDAHIIAGQGTIALEMADHLGNDTVIVSSAGGGGLLSGIAIGAKALHPGIRIIGVQTESCPAIIRSIQENRPVSVEVAPTLADGIAVSRPGDLTFSIIQKYVDDVIAVDEEAITGAILKLLEKASIIAEGAGAAPLAALLSGILPVDAKRYILIISGGNIEINTIDRILQRGSITEGRLIRMEVDLLDMPGSLWKLLGIISREKANILHIFHDRLNLENPINVTQVELDLEIRGHDHADLIFEKLEDAGYGVRRIS